MRPIRRRQRVDPRGCGGGRSSRAPPQSHRGGSPRVRGRVHARSKAAHVDGWIPAGAGEGASDRQNGQAAWVDPRGCGGGAGPAKWWPARAGGSPRVRGRAAAQEAVVRRAGWIPAGAGEGRTAAPTLPMPRVDPRGCGGGRPPAWRRPAWRGGSPRVRGRAGRATAGNDRTGWIPAGAGEGAMTRSRRSRRWVDPRGCGGGMQGISYQAQDTGGSPRVRGRVCSLAASLAWAGWIPAGAGEGSAGG